jgi:FMN phosphatase YigB (HAD superfamily)
MHPEISEHSFPRVPSIGKFKSIRTLERPKTQEIMLGDTGLAGLWRRDNGLAGIEAMLPRLRLVSLDIFDTLLFRTCQDPQDVFLEVGRRAVERGVLRNGLTAEEYRAVRIIALDTAYRTSQQEPSLEKILEFLPPDLGDQSRLLQIELQAEADFCYINPSILSLIQECRNRSIRIVLMSDMYLGRRRVLNLLSHAGFSQELADMAFVSVDSGSMKADGALYKRLLAANPDIKPNQILHVGDNFASDVEAACRAGIHALHYDVIRADTSGILGYERIHHKEVLSELYALRSLAMSLEENNLRIEDRAWLQLAGGVLGPFFAAFCDWVVETAASEGADAIAPFMREASVLTPMLRRAAESRGMSIPIIPLFVSREAVVLAGKKRADARLTQSLFEDRDFFKVRDLFKSLDLGVSLGRFAPFANKFLGEAWSVEFAPGRTLLQELEDFLSEEHTVDRIESVIERRRAALKGYMIGALGERERVVTVDIGFLGQIQMGIDSALAQEGVKTRFIHLMAFGKGNIGELLSCGVDIRAYAGSAGLNLDLINTIHRSAPVLEQLLMGREGSTLGYADVGSGFQPVLESNPMQEWEHEAKDIVRSGMLQFQDLWFYFRRAKPRVAARIQHDKRGWCRLIHRLIDMPTANEARIVGNLHNDSNFGSSRVVPICPPEEEDIIRRTSPCEYIRFLHNRSSAIWPQGCVTRVDPGAILSHFSIHLETGYLERMLKFSQYIATQSVGEIVVYGAGIVGRNLIRAAHLYGLKVMGAVDRKSDLWGTYLEGVEVMGLDQAVERGNHNYAVASFAFAEEIRRTIQTRYRDEAIDPNIFLPNDLYDRAVAART